MKGLLFITHKTEKYGYLQTVEIALKGGCKQIQLRMKDALRNECEEFAKQAKILCDEYGADLYINDCAEMCYKVRATGVHLGKLDMPPSQARLILGNGFKIGGTANTFGDIVNLFKQGVDYIGLGPFSYTTTKEHIAPILGLEGYRRIVQQCRENEINTPLIAIGGITRDDIPSIMQTGVAGIAISSAILNAENPIEETEKIMKLMINC